MTGPGLMRFRWGCRSMPGWVKLPGMGAILKGCTGCTWIPRCGKGLPIAKAWNALSNEAVHPDGRLGYVQGTGKQPSEGQPVTYDSKPDFEDYGLGCLLLAGSEVYKMK